MPDPLAAIVLWAAPEIPMSQAEELARQLGIPYVKEAPERGPLLCLGKDRLEFRIHGDAELDGSLGVDFDSTTARRLV